MNKNFLKESNFVSAVIYVANTTLETEKFIKMVNKILNDNFQLYEIICVVDIESREKFELHRIADSVENISIIYMGIKQGVESAMKAGMNLAIGDYILEFDSTYMDFEDSLIMEVYRKALEGYDVVGARVPRRYSSLESRMFYKVFNTFSRLGEEIGTERFRIISRRAVNKAESYSKTIPYRKVIYLACGLKVAGVEYTPIIVTGKGQEKDSFRKEIAIDTLLLFTDVAYRVAMTMSILMAAVMLFFLGYTCYIYFGSYTPVEGWSPIMGILTVGFFGIFLLMTFLIKYLQILIKINFNNKEYLVESIEKNNGK